MRFIEVVKGLCWLNPEAIESVTVEEDGVGYSICMLNRHGHVMSNIEIGTLEEAKAAASAIVQKLKGCE